MQERTEFVFVLADYYGEDGLFSYAMIMLMPIIKFNLISKLAADELLEWYTVEDCLCKFDYYRLFCFSLC